MRNESGLSLELKGSPDGMGLPFIVENRLNIL
jgi:hypothetical protein